MRLENAPMFFLEQFIVPRNVIITLYTSQHRCTELSRPSHNYELHKCEVGVSLILLSWRKLTIREFKRYQSQMHPIQIISTSSSCFFAAIIDVNPT